MTELPSCYAHTLPGVPRDKWQPLSHHLAAVADMAAAWAGSFSSDVWAHVAGALHDLGKAHPAFQAYLLTENGLDASEYDDLASSSHVNHSGAGAVLAMEQWPNTIGKTLAYLIAGHHAGLPDWYNSDSGQAALTVRLEKERIIADAIRDTIRTCLNELPHAPLPPSFLKPDGYHLWVRMLFSCLVDADFLETESFMDSQRAAVRSRYPSLDELKSRFDTNLDAMTAKAAHTPVNTVRQEVLAACRRTAELSPGLFSLTVPTGGGKTLSGTAFAVDHAILHGKRRVIYVIPYTSIIEQTADELRRFFGENSVVEHHSNLSSEKETPCMTLASENWDAPIIVTTNVQFFESLYAAKPGRCRKLHNITESVIILDEAQLLPPERLAPCVDALCRLTRDYGCSIVLSTATQPALKDPTKDTGRTTSASLLQAREIIPDPASLYSRLARTQICFPSDLNAPCGWESLAAQLCKHVQVLCIVNRRQDCHDLYQTMPPGTVHLSALMCGEHRSKVIADIKQRLNAGNPVRVISTQLVEAGVDIDFPVVYRALAGLDSIAQAAGRCNREGRLGTQGQVHVFVPPKPSPPGLLRKGEDTTRELISLPGFRSDTTEGYKQYFCLYYSKVNDTGATWLLDRLTKDVPHIHFRTAAEEFQLIDDIALSIIVRYGESPKLIDRLRFSGPVREVMRRLQRYTVSVPPRIGDRLRGLGLIEEIHPGVFAQTLSSVYKDTGLDIFSDCLPSEDLVI